MSLYYDASGAIREIPADLYAEWVAADNPKASAWSLAPDQPEHDPESQAVRWGGAQWAVESVVVPVPDQVPAHHLRRALSQLGVRDEVEAMIASLPAGHPMRNDWLTAPYFNRNAQGIEAVRVARAWTREFVDLVFITAGAVVT